MKMDSSINNLSCSSRRNKIHKRKLEFLKFVRDSLERRLAAVNASIVTLENQIKRDESINNDSSE